jgi:hypothetical protein
MVDVGLYSVWDKTLAKDAMKEASGTHPLL